MITKMAKKEKSYKKWNKLSIRRKVLEILGLIFRYALLISLGMIIITPLYATFKEGITAQEQLGLKNSAWIPPATSLQSFITAWLIMDYDFSIFYSLGNALLLAFLQTLCAALAAYSFTRLRFKGSGLLFGLVIFTIIVPSQSIMLAQYITFRNFDILGLINLFTGSPLNLLSSPAALYIMAATGVGIKGGLYIYILRQAYRQLPISIEEAAYVDGAGFLRTFFSIVIPGVSSSLTTVAVLSFVWNYADTYFMSLFNPTKYQLSLRLADVQKNMRWAIGDVQKLIPAQYIVNLESPMVHKGVASACAVLTIAPLLILYLFVQKRFVQGVERSGLGGE